MPLDYDPTGLNPANLITQEVQSLAVSVAVQPVNGSFYVHDLVVEGEPVGGGAYQVLEKYKDYTFSPMYLTIAMGTGREVFSWILMLTDWNKVRITYRATGAQPDATLAQEVLNAQPFDMLNFGNWQSFRGEQGNVKPYVNEPELYGLPLLEAVTNRLDAIENAISNPAGINSILYGYTVSDLGTPAINNATTLLYGLQPADMGKIFYIDNEDSVGNINTGKIVDLRLNSNNFDLTKPLRFAVYVVADGQTHIQLSSAQPNKLRYEGDGLNYTTLYVKGVTKFFEVIYDPTILPAGKWVVRGGDVEVTVPA